MTNGHQLEFSRTSPPLPWWSTPAVRRQLFRWFCTRNSPKPASLPALLEAQEAAAELMAVDIIHFGPVGGWGVYGTHSGSWAVCVGLK